MNRNLLILGAGMFGAVVKEIAESIGDYEKIAFLDDTFGIDESNGNCHETSIGKLKDFESFRAEFDYAIVSIGNSEIRMEWTKRLIEAGFTIPIIVSPGAFVSASAQICRGAVVAPMAVINPNSYIGESSFITAGAVIDHNSLVADYCNVQCGTVVMSGAMVADFTNTQPNEVIRKTGMAFTLEN